MPERRQISRPDQEERIAAANAKALMRREGVSLRFASAQAGVPARAVLKWFPTSVVRDPRGRYVALADRERIPMVAVLEEYGPAVVMTRGSTERQLVGQHHDAIRVYLHPRRHDAGPLLAMRGMTVGGHRLETDPRMILETFERGDLDFLDIYVDDVEDQ